MITVAKWKQTNIRNRLSSNDKSPIKIKFTVGFFILVK